MDTHKNFKQLNMHYDKIVSYEAAKNESEKDTVNVFIGLGGFGCTTVNHIKALFQKQYRTNPLVFFLTIDCDEHHISQLLSKNGGYMETYETLCLNTPLTNDFLSQLDMGQTKLPPGYNGGTRGIRQLGRAIFATEESYAAFCEKIAVILSIPYCRQKSDINIFFICGSTGGFGSGVLTDSAYITRRLIDEEGFNTAALYGMVYTPDTVCLYPGIADSAVANNFCNGYALLKELNYFMQPQNYGQYAQDDDIPPKAIFDPGKLFLLSPPKGIGADDFFKKTAADLMGIITNIGPHAHILPTVTRGYCGFVNRVNSRPDRKEGHFATFGTSRLSFLPDRIFTFCAYLLMNNIIKNMNSIECSGIYSQKIEESLFISSIEQKFIDALFTNRTRYEQEFSINDDKLCPKFKYVPLIGISGIGQVKDYAKVKAKKLLAQKQDEFCAEKLVENITACALEFIDNSYCLKSFGPVALYKLAQLIIPSYGQLKTAVQKKSQHLQDIEQQLEAFGSNRFANADDFADCASAYCRALFEREALYTVFPGIIDKTTQKIHQHADALKKYSEFINELCNTLAVNTPDINTDSLFKHSVYDLPNLPGTSKKLTEFLCEYINRLNISAVCEAFAEAITVKDVLAFAENPHNTGIADSLNKFFTNILNPLCIDEPEKFAIACHLSPAPERLFDVEYLSTFEQGTPEADMLQAALERMVPEALDYLKSNSNPDLLNKYSQEIEPDMKHSYLFIANNIHSLSQKILNAVQHSMFAGVYEEALETAQTDFVYPIDAKSITGIEVFRNAYINNTAPGVHLNEIWKTSLPEI